MKLRFTLGIFGCTLLTLLTPSILKAQAGDFGTNRQPRTCDSTSAPKSGRIDAAQAKIYAACEAEKPVNNYSVRFIDILSLEVAPKPRRVNMRDLQEYPNIDIEKPIYDLKGSVISYWCYRVSDSQFGYRAGRNCTIRRVPESTGRCFQNTFGNWNCGIGTYSATSEQKMPAPAN